MFFRSDSWYYFAFQYYIPYRIDSYLESLNFQEPTKTIFDDSPYKRGAHLWGVPSLVWSKYIISDS